MKTTNALQRIAAGMLTFSLVVMFAVLGFGLTKPIWAVDGVWEVYDQNSLSHALTNVQEGEIVRLTRDIKFYGDIHFNNCTVDFNGYHISIGADSTYPGSSTVYFPAICYGNNVKFIDSAASENSGLYRFNGNYPVFISEGDGEIEWCGGKADEAFWIENNTHFIVSGGYLGWIEVEDDASIQLNGGCLGVLKVLSGATAQIDWGEITRGIMVDEESTLILDESTCEVIEKNDAGQITKIVKPEHYESEPEPEPSTDVEIKDDNQDKNENNFPWAGVIIGGVAVTATVAAVAVACLAVRRK